MVVLLVCTFVSRIAYKVINEFACMELLSKVYLGPRNNLIHFGDDPDYDPDPGSGSRIRIAMYFAYERSISGYRYFKPYIRSSCSV